MNNPSERRMSRGEWLLAILFLASQVETLWLAVRMAAADRWPWYAVLALLVDGVLTAMVVIGMARMTRPARRSAPNATRGREEADAVEDQAIELWRTSRGPR